MARNNPVLLTGPTRGLDGRSVLAKARAPLITDGRIGDFWIDTVSKKLYGPKNAAEWPDNGLIKGDKGWTPVFATVIDGTRRVQQIVDWTGGEGTKPAVGQYVGADGLVDDIEDAVDFRGPGGPQALINALDAKSDVVTYETLTALGEDDTDNEKASIKRLFEPGGMMTFRTVAEAEAATVPAPVTHCRLLDLGVVRRRSDVEPDVDGKHRSADRFTDTGDHDSAAGGWWVDDDQDRGTTSLQPLTGVYSIASRAEAAGRIVPAPVMRISVLHEGLALDYIRDVAGTALETAGGAMWSPVGEAYPHHFGWSAEQSTADQTLALKALFEWGDKVCLPHGYTYETDYVVANLTRNTTIRIEGVHKGSAAEDFLTQPMVRLNCGSVTRYKVTIMGSGTIDVSNREVIPNVASGSGYGVRNSSSLVCTGAVTCFAANSLAGAKADVAIGPSYCDNTVISGWRFLGFADHPIYVTGGPSGGSAGSEDVVITQCLFMYNSGCIRLAREHKRATISCNIAVDNKKFLIVAGGDTNWKTAEKIVAYGNIIDKCADVAFDIRYTREKTAVLLYGNHVYDWGLAGPGMTAIRLRGVSNARVFGNVIKPDAETDESSTTSCATGVYITSAYGEGDESGTYYDCRNVSVYDNDIQVLTRAENENNGGIVTRFITADSFAEFVAHGNRITVPSGVPDMICALVGVDSLRQANGVQRIKPGIGLGVGGANPTVPFEVAGNIIASRKSDASRLIELDVDRGTGAAIASRSPPASARNFFLNATTDLSNTAPTGGAVSLNMQVLGVTGVQINATRQVFFPAVATSAVAPNAILDSGAGNQLLRSTSSVRYKCDIEDLEIERALEIYEGLRAIWYRSTAERDRSDWSWYGLLAEEVAEIDPRLVVWGYPDSDYEEVERYEEIERIDVARIVEEDGTVTIEERPRIERHEWTERVLKEDAVMVPDGVQYDRVALVCLMAERHLSHERDQRLTQIEERLADLEAGG